MLLIKLISKLWPREFTHLKFRNGETVLINGVDNFSSLSVTVRLDHGKRSFSFALKFVSSEDVSILCELQLSGVYVDNAADIEVFIVDAASHPLHKHSSIFKIILRQI